MIIETIILKTHYVWRITRRGGCPCSPLLGPPVSPQSHPTDTGKSKWGTALGLDNSFLTTWHAAHTYLLRSWASMTSHTWFDSCLHCQNTRYTLFNILSNFSFKSLSKPKVRAYTSNLSREETDAGSHMSSKPAELPCKNLCQKWGGKNGQSHSFFEILLWETPWLIIPSLFTSQNMKIHHNTDSFDLILTSHVNKITKEILSEAVTSVLKALTMFFLSLICYRL